MPNPLPPPAPFSDFGVRPSFGLRVSAFGFPRQPAAPLQTPLPAIIVCQNYCASNMKRRLIYGVVVVALSVNLIIGARMYLSSAQAAEKDSPYPSLELFRSEEHTSELQSRQ